MKTVISLVLIGLMFYGGWELYALYERYSTGQVQAEQQAANVAQVNPEELQGMPKQWEQQYKNATNASLGTWKAWMKTYAQRVGDPRRAWIELDYMVRISMDDPQEAKQIYSMVKDRMTDTNSPVYPRLQQLAKSYE